MTALRLDLDNAQLAGLLRDLREMGRLGQQGLIRARNNTGRRLRTQGGRQVRQRLALDANYVRTNFGLKNATRAQPVTELRVRRRATRLDRLPNRDVEAGGINVQAKRGSRKTIYSAFRVRLNRGMEEGGNGMGIAVRNELLNDPALFPNRKGTRASRAVPARFRNYIAGLTRKGRRRSSRRYTVLRTTSVHDLFATDYDASLQAKTAEYYRMQLEAELRSAMRRARLQ